MASYLVTEVLRFTTFMRNVWHDRRSFLLEVYLAVQAVVFGLWLLMPWSTFSTVSHAYRVLDAMLPEWVWGSLFAVQGFTHLWALDRGRFRWRRGMVLVMLFLWLTVAMAFLMTVPLSTATPMYLLPILGSLWAYHAHTLNGLTGHGRGEGVT